MSSTSRLCRALLRLYPVSVRQMFGVEMLELAEARALRERKSGRPWAATRANWFVLRDSIRAIPQAYSDAFLDYWRNRDNRGRPPRMSLRDRIMSLLRDISHAFRNMRRAPGFTAVAVLTLALGIGANTAIFSVVNGVLLRPLPYNDPDGLITIWTARSERGQTMGSMSQPDLYDIEAQVTSIESASGYQSYGLTLTGMGDAEVIEGAAVTDGLLRVFQVAPHLGRDIRADDNIPGGHRVAMIGHAFWQERLGGDQAVLGTTLYVEGAAHEIVGVAPPGFEFPDGSEVWVPLQLETDDCGRDCHLLRVTGRLAPATTLGTARSEATALAIRLEEAFPEENYNKRFNILTLEETVVGDVRTALLVLLAAVGMVLLIACANVANLLLARASSRSGEIAMRSALGASRGRIMQHLLLEAIVLASLGGAAGIALAKAGLGTMLRFAPDSLPRADNVVIDGTVLVFTLAAVVAIALIFGLIPAMRLAGVSAAGILSRSERGGTGAATRDLSRSSLLVAEVALSLMLLFGAGLLLRSFSELTKIDLGFEKEGVLIVRVSLPEAIYEDPDRAVQFFSSMEQRVSVIPGVERVGSVFGSPLGGTRARSSVEFLDRAPAPPGQEDVVIVRVATPGYHDALNIPLVRGRLFNSGDINGTRRVVLISQGMADRFYADQDPLGKQFTVGLGWGYGVEDPWTVVGIVGDVRSVRLTSEPIPEIYVPHAQMGGGYMAVVVRTAPGIANVLPALRREVKAVDPNVPLRGVQTMEATVERAVGPARFYLSLLAVFASVAVALAAIGLYGVVAYLVSRRTREIGIRMALGAKRGDVFRLVLAQGLRPVVIGVVLGVGGAYAGSRVLQSLLYNVEPTDPGTFVGVTALLLVVIVLALLLPAGRASRIPPMSALRVD